MNEMLMDNISISGEWIIKVENDDASAIVAADRDMKTFLCNGWFACEPLNRSSSSVDFAVGRPWCFAACHGSHKVMKVLMDIGITVSQRDYNKNNVLHCLVITSFLNADSEKNVVETYDVLRGIMRQDQLEGLLLAENVDGFHPVELAIHLGVFLLFERMFQCEHIYVSKILDDGILKIIHYDVTKYENLCSCRRERSPTQLMALMDGRQLNMTSNSNFYKSDFVKKWLHIKYLSNRIYIVLWFTFRLLYMLSYMALKGPLVLVSNEKKTQLGLLSNASSTDVVDHTEWKITITYTLQIASLSISMLIILWDIIEVIMKVLKNNSWKRKTPIGKKSYVVQYITYRIYQCLMAVFVMYDIMIDCLLLNGYRVHSQFEQCGAFIYFLYIMIYIFMVYSLGFFLQMLPYIGYIIIIVNRMLIELAEFLILYMVWNIAFSLAFYSALQLVPSDERPFNSYFESMYALFLTMFNMLNYTPLIKYTDSFYFINIAFTTTTCILLINFLIATMSNTVAYMSQYKHTFTTVQRLCVLNIIEDRVALIIPRVAWWWKKKCIPCKGDRIVIQQTIIKCRKPVTIVSY